jgi:hypothetical protein
MSSNNEGKDCVHRLACNAELLDMVVYNCTLKRKILLEGEAVVLAGVVAANIYRFPGPDIPYEEQGNKWWKEVMTVFQLPIPKHLSNPLLPLELPPCQSRKLAPVRIDQSPSLIQPPFLPPLRYPLITQKE